MITQTDVSLATLERELMESDQSVSMEELGQDVLVSTYHDLDRIAQSLETLVKDHRGMSPTMESIYQKTIAISGAGVLPVEIVSLENYRGSPERQTVMSLESVGETLQDIWNKIKASIVRVMQALADFVSKLFGGVKKMEDRVVRLKRRAAQRFDVKPTGSVVVPNPERLSLNGKVDRSAISDGLDLITKDFYDSNESYLGIVGLYQKQVSKLLSGSGLLQQSDIEAFDDEELKLTRDISGIWKKYVGNNELPGAKVLRFSTKSALTNSKEVIGGIEIIDHPRSKSVSGEMREDIPDAKWILTQLEKIERLAGEIQKSGRMKKIQSYLNQQKELNEKMSQRVDAAGKFEKAGEKDTRDVVKHAMKSMRRDYIKTLTRLDNYTFRYLRSVLIYLSNALDELESTADE